MRLRPWVLVLAAALFALSPDTGRAASADAEVHSIESTVQSIRHLTAVHPVKVSFLDNSKFNAVVRGVFQRGNPEAEIQLSQREEVTLGLLKPTDNLHQIIFSGLTAQVIGLYDQTSKTLYIRNQSNVALGFERHVIAHEYTHALQDQHYHLAKVLPDTTRQTYRDSDAINAHHALTEGDAVNTEVLFIEKTYSQKEIQEVLKFESQSTPKIPKATQLEFNFAYTSGVTFVQTLYGKGGMAAVDSAYAHLPANTYDIMHPAAYLTGWKPATVTMHGLKGLDTWKVVDDDVDGAFGYYELLWEYLPKARALAVTTAYRGDRYLYLNNGTQDAMLLRSVWTTHAAALAAKEAMVAALHVRFPRATISRGAATMVNAAGMSVYLSVSGSRLNTAYAPTAQEASTIGTTPTT